MLSVVFSFNSMSSLTCLCSLSMSFNSTSFSGDGLPQESSAGVASGSEAVSMGTTWSLLSTHMSMDVLSCRCSAKSLPLLVLAKVYVGLALANLLFCDGLRWYAP